MQNVKYTFLLPAFKSRYLEEALESIRQQTYKNFKVIVSDDCSPEPLKPIFDLFAHDSRFSYRRNEQNMGSKSLVSHWNLLADLCDTEFLIMAGDDDVYDPHFLEEIDKLTIKYPEVDLFHARACVIDEKGEVVKHDAMYEEEVSQLEFLAFFGKEDHIECIANNVYRASQLKQTGGFVDYPLAWASDTATNNKMARNGVASTTKILFRFRMSGINISSIGKDNAIARKKMQAAFLFDAQLSNLFSSFPANGTKLYKHRLEMAEKSQKLVVSTTIWAHCPVLTFTELIQCVRHLKKNKYIITRYEVYKIIAKWLLGKRFNSKPISQKV